MEKNQLNSGSLTELQVGETLLTVARKVSNGKIQLEQTNVCINSIKC